MLALMNGVWSPKEGDKCDIRPSELGDASYFTPGII